MGFNREMPETQGGKTIMFAPWPKPLGTEFKESYGLDETDDKFVKAKYELVGQGRNLRREGNIQSSKKVKFMFRPVGEIAAYEVEVLKILLNAESVELVNASFSPQKGTPAVHGELGDLFLPLAGLVDVEAETGRLDKERLRIQGEIEKVEQKLKNPSFVQKVPSTVLEEHKGRLVEWQNKLGQVERALQGLRS
jgi:valyl-tRNA synthetase